MVDGSVVEVPLSSVPSARWEAYAVRTGWDPREAAPAYAAYIVTPSAIQAWWESNGTAERTLMRDGRWLG